MTTILEQDGNHGQRSVSTHRRMPTDNGASQSVSSALGETIQFYYYDASGVLTIDAGQAAGTVVVAKIAGKNILNTLGDRVGNYGDTSFAFATGTIATTLKPFRGVRAEQAEFTAENNLQGGKSRATDVTNGFNNGDFCIDHEHGVIYAVKATTGVSDTASYKVSPLSAIPTSVGIGHGIKTVTSAGADEALASSTACREVTIQAIIANTGRIAVGGSGVDATVTTGTGATLASGDSITIKIDDLSKVFIDSTVSGEGVRYTYST
jgi:hypothetical protein